MIFEKIVGREYLLERHGGRACDRWRTLRTLKSESEALEAFVEVKREMRQGGLRIFRARDGVVVRLYQAPLLRTRW